MPRFKPRVCSEENCSNEYTPSGPAAKFCEPCAEERRLLRQRRSAQTYRIRHGLVERPGVGKGGNQKHREDNPDYKNGIGYFMKRRSEIKIERRFCNRCNKDLLNVTRFEWCVHHMDHDRTNNDDSNFELLCKRCHQIEHDCHEAFEGVTTIPKGSRTQEGSKRTASYKDDDIV